MDDPPAVRVGDRVAGVDDAAQQATEGQLALAGSRCAFVRAVEPLDRGLERLSLDESHRVVRTAVGIAAQAVDRHDPRVLQPPGDLGLQEEPRLAGRVVRVVGLELLERDLAVQLAVKREEDLAQPAACVRPEDLETPCAGCRCSLERALRDHWRLSTAAKGLDPHRRRSARGRRCVRSGCNGWRPGPPGVL